MRIEVSDDETFPGGWVTVTATLDDGATFRRATCALVVSADNSLGGLSQGVHTGHHIELEREVASGERFVFEVGIPADQPATFEGGFHSVTWEAQVVLERAGPLVRSERSFDVTPPPDPAVLVHTAALATYLDRRRRTRSPLGSSWQWAVGPLALGVCMSIVGIVVGSEVAALVAAGIALAVGGAVAAVWTFWMRRGDRYAFLLDTGVSERGGVVRVHLEQPATEVLTGAIVSRVCLRRIRSRGSRVSIWFDVVATVEVGIGSTRFDLAIPSACPPTCTIFGSEVDHWVRIMRPHDLRRRQGYLRRRSDRPLYIT